MVNVVPKVMACKISKCFSQSIDIFLITNIANSDYISEWKSKGLFDEGIQSPAATNMALASLFHINTKLRVKFDGHCLKQDNVTFTYNQLVNVYIV